jgi:capsular polysaccharide export protein
MYFNARSPTDLEDILRTYEFDTDAGILTRATAAIALIQSLGLSKYNASPSVDIGRIYGPKQSKRVLVLGQVERDASIIYGCSSRMTNNELVLMARQENPDAQVIYKPHPEVLQGIAGTLSDPNHVMHAAEILREDISLADSLKTIDHVYTITSLAGFEALMRGIRVTTAGCPFYSGWGLTDDRQHNSRRGRKLTVEQVFAAAYILYAKYIDPATGTRIEIEDAIEILRRQIAEKNAPTGVGLAGDMVH